eukprot:TRINITY_DN4756_c0_g1_i3.p1 TRINITY_DN4756_c0_g1~~TRINITY_DN4756_c0_g1_i3.p1  ORF type:complete len:192 (+),score=18.69 TRINITY_DN4756_c0_g1_i3:102-677(+)
MDPRVRPPFPDPPAFYKLYANFGTSDAPVEPYGVPPLPPPKPPTGTEYKIFGQVYSTEAVVPRLEDQSEVRVLSTTDNGDLTQELQNLTRALLANFLELTKVLVANPAEYDAKVRDIRDILVNIHYRVNAFRPHQARETLLCLMQDQKQRKEATIQHIEKVFAEVSAVLADVRATLGDAMPMDTDPVYSFS